MLLIYHPYLGPGGRSGRGTGSRWRSPPPGTRTPTASRSAYPSRVLRWNCCCHTRTTARSHRTERELLHPPPPRHWRMETVPRRRYVEDLDRRSPRPPHREIPRDNSNESQPHVGGQSDLLSLGPERTGRPLRLRCDGEAGLGGDPRRRTGVLTVSAAQTRSSTCGLVRSTVRPGTRTSSGWRSASPSTCRRGSLVPSRYWRILQRDILHQRATAWPSRREARDRPAGQARQGRHPTETGARESGFRVAPTGRASRITRTIRRTRAAHPQLDDPAPKKIDLASRRASTSSALVAAPKKIAYRDHRRLRHVEVESGTSTASMPTPSGEVLDVNRGAAPAWSPTASGRATRKAREPHAGARNRLARDGPEPEVKEGFADIRPPSLTEAAKTWYSWKAEHSGSVVVRSFYIQTAPAGTHAALSEKGSGVLG